MKKLHNYGLGEAEQEEFQRLMVRIFELYDKKPQGGMRKIFGGRSVYTPDNFVIFFQGTPEDLFEVQKFLNSRHYEKI